MKKSIRNLKIQPTDRNECKQFNSAGIYFSNILLAITITALYGHFGIAIERVKSRAKFHRSTPQRFLEFRESQRCGTVFIRVIHTNKTRSQYLRVEDLMKFFRFHIRSLVPVASFMNVSSLHPSSAPSLSKLQQSRWRIAIYINLATLLHFFRVVSHN